jgi:hypothetical protein
MLSPHLVSSFKDSTTAFGLLLTPASLLLGLIVTCSYPSMLLIRSLVAFTKEPIRSAPLSYPSLRLLIRSRALDFHNFLISDQIGCGPTFVEVYTSEE